MTYYTMRRVAPEGVRSEENLEDGAWTVLSIDPPGAIRIMVVVMHRITKERITVTLMNMSSWFKEDNKKERSFTKKRKEKLKNNYAP